MNRHICFIANGSVICPHLPLYYPQADAMHCTVVPSPIPFVAVVMPIDAEPFLLSVIQHSYGFINGKIIGSMRAWLLSG